MPQNWSGKTFGSRRLLGALMSSLRWMPVPMVYLGADIFVLPWVLLLSKGSRSSYRYFRDIHGYGRAKAAWYVCRNMRLFSQVVIDRFAMYAGRKFEVECIGQDEFDARAMRPEGFVQMSSHIGNYEIAGYSLNSVYKEIRPVVFAYEKQFVMDNRNNMFGRTNVNMIALQEDMSHLYEIDATLSGGSIVSFPTDRFMGGAKHMECEFLGRKARFPQGPFSVATMRGLDVLAVNVMKTGLMKYTIYVTPLEYDRTAPRKQQMAQLLQGYVGELERRLRQYPDQWYNFYDFWN